MKQNAISISVSKEKITKIQYSSQKQGSANQTYKEIIDTLRHENRLLNYSDFKKLLENKTVCIVGPAEYMLYELENNGAFIDSFDLVIKINGMVRFHTENPKLANYYGKKQDIIFSTLCTDRHDVDDISACYRNINQPTIIFFRTVTWNRCIYNAIMQNKYIKLCFFNLENLNMLTHKLKALPSTGLLAIYEAILSKAKKIHVTGITFGHPIPQYSDYVYAYHPRHKRVKIMRDNNNYWGAHDMSAEEALFMQFYMEQQSRQKRITIDKFMSKYLEKNQ